MMIPREHDMVKLVISLFTSDARQFGAALSMLAERFGEADLISGVMPPPSAAYYGDEFGSGLLRKMVTFRRLVPITDLPAIKIFTNSIEASRSSPDGRRSVNIDPGYMALEKFVLASCKGFSHRIFIGDGVFAELTLMYVGRGFKALPWTYPDYYSSEMISLLTHVRRRYAYALGKGLGSAAANRHKEH